MSDKKYHTCVYKYDTFTSGDKPYGVYLETIGFYSAAQTRKGLVRAADNAAFWDVNKTGGHGGHYRRLISVDGNEI